MSWHEFIAGKKQMLKAGALMALAALLVFGGSASEVRAQCQTPLFIQESQVEANVMVLFDNSGSMNEAMYHPDFDPAVTYPGNYNRDSMYYINTEGNYTINGKTAWLVMAPGGHSGRYVGNYVNWIFFTATDEQLVRGVLPDFTRMDVAHEVVHDIIDRSDGVRFGLANFNTSNGGFIRKPCGTDNDEVRDDVANIFGTTWTPLAETMENILDYFSGDHGTDPIQAKCQKNFLIVMTDGFPTQDVDVSAYLHDADEDGNDPGNCTSIGSLYLENSNQCSDHMDDVAYYMRHNDLRNDLGDAGESWEDGQNVVTYTIGFGVDANLLAQTAENGDGLYLLATDAAELWDSLEMIMLDIISRMSTGAAVAVVSTERGDEDYLFRGKFMPGEWTGFLEAFEMPYETGDIPTWEAGSLLAHRSAADRVIFTAVDGTIHNFTTTQAGDLWEAMDADDSTEAADLITWTRGSWVAGLRERPDDWKLGDIIHSTPVVVGDPTHFTMDVDYQQFMDAWSNRQKMVYVGSNDGMLHAFDAATGQEKWAFLPESSLPILETIADPNYCHNFTCDLTPKVRDIKINNAWRTILISGDFDGGKSYFALDVTDPLHPEFMWEIELPVSYGGSKEIEVTVIDDVPVMLLGSGLNDQGLASLFEYNIEDGTLIGSVPLSSLGASNRNRATGAKAVDLDLDGNSDLCYIADLSGNVYRIYFNDTSSTASWDISELYSGNQGITAMPVPAFGEAGEVNVYFGTGSYLETDDIITLENNTFYCVIDRQNGAENPTLIDQTDDIDDVTGADGWYIDMEYAGERVTEPAAVVAGSVFYTSYLPSGEPCEAGGHSWLSRVSYEDGSVPDDGVEDGFDGQRRMDMGEGIASRPVVDIINESVIVQSSDATITIEGIGQVFFNLDVQSWQETHGTTNSYPGGSVTP
ncbi:MAG: PQQ-binding-like beta-propeller repeat protein [bacterium]|nr:PQQ-binding-like beta-propeller repeat protein [bacterium]